MDTLVVYPLEFAPGHYDSHDSRCSSYSLAVGDPPGTLSAEFHISLCQMACSQSSRDHHCAAPHTSDVVVRCHALGSFAAPVVKILVAAARIELYRNGLPRGACQDETANGPPHRVLPGDVHRRCTGRPLQCAHCATDFQ